MKEFQLVQSVSSLIPRSLQGKIGIGDDADFLDATFLKGGVLASSDVIVEDVDFILDRVTPEQIGYKALAVNLSDMAAMGAKPLAYLVTLGLPKSTSPGWVLRCYRGIVDIARRYQLKNLGGDLSSSKDVFISITILGTPVKKPILRSGAKPGDVIAVTGELGGSITGRHLGFEPRIQESTFLVKNFHPTSMIDISDGFLQDLEHILEASKAGARLDLSKIPVSQPARLLAKGDIWKSYEHALSDGEDFELIFTLPKVELNALKRVWAKKNPRTRLSIVGEVTRKKKIEWISKEQAIGAERFKRKGFSHFE